MTSECFGTNRTSVLLGLFLLLLIFTVSANAEQLIQGQFKLEGKHTFEDSGAATWIVAQELIDEESGDPAARKILRRPGVQK